TLTRRRTRADRAGRSLCGPHRSRAPSSRAPPSSPIFRVKAFRSLRSRLHYPPLRAPQDDPPAGRPRGRRRRHLVSCCASVRGPHMTTLQTTSAVPFLDRDLGWLEFNKRVLHEALDDRTPLLERLKFLAIFSSNLDEWFMKRAEGLREAQASGTVPSADGAPGSNRLAPVREAILPMLAEQARVFTDVLRPELRRQGIH